MQDIQKSLDRCVRVLLEMKHRQGGLTQRDFDEIDDIVELMQQLSRKLVKSNSKPDNKRLVIWTINKFIEYWKKFRGSDM